MTTYVIHIVIGHLIIEHTCSCLRIKHSHEVLGSLELHLVLVLEKVWNAKASELIDAALEKTSLLEVSGIHHVKLWYVLSLLHVLVLNSRKSLII